MSRPLISLFPGHGGTEDVAARRCAWRLADGRAGEGTLAEALDNVADGAVVDLVLPASDALLAQVALTRRQARHIRKVLPYLLEDALLDPPESLWFTHGKAREGNYPVVACKQELVQALSDYLVEASITPRGMWVDADLVCAQGADDLPLLLSYGQAAAEQLLVPSREKALVVPTSELDDVLVLAGLERDGLGRYDADETLDLLATRLSSPVPAGLNLLHSELKPRLVSSGPKSGWRRDWLPVARFAALVLVGVWGLFLVQKAAYEQAAREAQQRSAALYEELFPGDRAVAVERQFRQRMTSVSGAGESGAFLQMLAPMGERIRGEAQDIEIRRMQYDQLDGLVQLDVRAPDFDSLQVLRERIQAAGLAAEITEGRSQGDQVSARIRVGQADAG